MSDENREFLPYGRQCIDEADIEAVVSVLRGDWLTGGPAVDAFEQCLANACGTEDAVVVANGTAALHIAMIAAGIGPGDTVVVPTVTFLASANAARYMGATVVLADVDPDSGLMTEATCHATVDFAGGNVRAIVPVHLGGRQVDLCAIHSIARKYDAVVIEDACHAIGGRHPGKDGSAEPVGKCSWSDFATFSFHPVKTVTSGEGGAVTFRDKELGKSLRLARNHGLMRLPRDWQETQQAFDEGMANPWYYEMHEPGFNYRLTDLHCALGQSQLSRLPEFHARRETLARRYDVAFSDSNLVRPAHTGNEVESGHHLYQVLINFSELGRSRRSIMEALREFEIGTQVHYIPLHRQPYYKRHLEEVGQSELTFPGGDAFYERCLSLPLYPTMSEDDVDYVAERLLFSLA